MVCYDNTMRTKLATLLLLLLLSGCSLYTRSYQGSAIGTAIGLPSQPFTSPVPAQADFATIVRPPTSNASPGMKRVKLAVVSGSVQLQPGTPRGHENMRPRCLPYYPPSLPARLSGCS